VSYFIGLHEQQHIFEAYDYSNIPTFCWGAKLISDKADFCSPSWGPSS